MVIIAGHSLVDGGERDRCVEAFRDLVERARAADGCIDVAVSADPIDPRRFNILEVWESAEAIDRWQKVANGPDLGVESDDSAVKRYDATDDGPMF